VWNYKNTTRIPSSIKNDKKVPMKYETKQAKASETIELKLDIDNNSEKVKLLW
jgi:hypothetical protein